FFPRPWPPNPPIQGFGVVAAGVFRSVGARRSLGSNGREGVTPITPLASKGVGPRKGARPMWQKGNTERRSASKVLVVLARAPALHFSLLRPPVRGLPLRRLPAAPRVAEQAQPAQTEKCQGGRLRANDITTVQGEGGVQRWGRTTGRGRSHDVGADA